MEQEKNGSSKAEETGDDVPSLTPRGKAAAIALKTGLLKETEGRVPMSQFDAFWDGVEERIYPALFDYAVEKWLETRKERVEKNEAIQTFGRAFARSFQHLKSWVAKARNRRRV